MVTVVVVVDVMRYFMDRLKKKIKSVIKVLRLDTVRLLFVCRQFTVLMIFIQMKNMKHFAKRR